MQNKLISVIVPVYNGENYISVFMNMLQHQTTQNFEVVMVDDGSRDKSLEKLKLYANDRYFIFHQENKGVSSARNLGIKKAHGDIFVFHDIDDVITDDYLEKLVNSLNDVVQLGFCGYAEETEDSINFEYNPTEKEYNDRMSFVNDMVKHHGVCSALWNKVYWANIIKNNHILFDESITIGEDLLFTVEYLKYVKKVKSISKILYVYNVNPTGAMNSSGSSKVYKETWNSEWVALQKSELLLQSITSNEKSVEIKNKKFRVASKLLYFSKKLDYKMPEDIRIQLKSEIRKNFLTFFWHSHDDFRMKLRIFKRLLLSMQREIS